VAHPQSGAVPFVWNNPVPVPVQVCLGSSTEGGGCVAAQTGSLYFGTVIYLIAVVGLGLFISALSATRQQAILGAFLAMVPMIMLSGFAPPIDNMPDWLQPVTLIGLALHPGHRQGGVSVRAAP